jgi:hypothetical protein
MRQRFVKCIGIVVLSLVASTIGGLYSVAQASDDCTTTGACGTPISCTIVYNSCDIEANCEQVQCGPPGCPYYTTGQYCRLDNCAYYICV